MGAGALLLDDDPAVVGENALPAPRARGIDVHHRLGLGVRGWQQARARPVGLVPRLRRIGGQPPRRVYGQRRQEHSEEGEGRDAQDVHGGDEDQSFVAEVLAERADRSCGNGIGLASDAGDDVVCGVRLQRLECDNVDRNPLAFDADRGREPLDLPPEQFVLGVLLRHKHRDTDLVVFDAVPMSVT